PSVTRVFSRSRELFVFLQVHERAQAGAAPPSLVAFVTLYRAGATALQTLPLRVTMEPVSRAVPIRFAVPLGGLASGQYECQVSVLDPSGAKAAFWRAPIVIVNEQ